MKKTVKVLLTAALAIGIGAFANAQSASISANATVISEIAVTSVSDLNFGTIVVNQKKIVSEMGDTRVSTGTAINNGSRGEFTVAAPADVTVSLLLPNVLTGSGGSLPILFEETLFNEVEGSYTRSTLYVNFQPGNGGYVINPNSPSERFANFPTFDIGGGVNGVRVFIGGTVDATNSTAGSYTGTITLNATYN
nr:hypothetical protein [Cytophagales bacterium]